MATDRIFVDYVAEQLGLGARLGHKKMFGEYALYVDGKVVAFACDDSLLVKPNPAVARLHPNLPLRKVHPDSKDYPVADELLDDAEALRALLLATFDALPASRPTQPAKKNVAKQPPGRPGR